MTQWMTWPKLFSGVRTSHSLALARLGFYVSALVFARSQDRNHDQPSTGCCTGLREIPTGISDVPQGCHLSRHTSSELSFEDIDEPTSDNSDEERS